MTERMTDTLFLLRHGETVWNTEGRIHGRADSPLTQVGLMQASALANAMAGANIRRVFCSPQGRAIQTATIIAERIASPITQDHRLDERDFGRFEGWKKIDIAKEGAVGQALLHPVESESRVPGGESMRETAVRVMSFVHFVGELRDHTVAAVTHSHALQSLLGTLMGTEDYERFRHDNAAYAIIRWINVEPKVIRWNVTDHLADLAYTDRTSLVRSEKRRS
jgi:broad specificity phosphatase PhoE